MTEETKQPEINLSALDYFTVEQLSKYSHIGRDRLYSAIQSRELEHIKVGARKVIISKKDFEKWFEKQKKKPVPYNEEIHGTKTKAATEKRRHIFAFPD